jgi:hypothetical protein
LNCIPNYGLLQKHKRDAVFVEDMFHIKPKSFDINGQTCYRITVQDAVSQLLSHKEIVEWIDTTDDRQSKDGVIRDIMDGSVYRNHDLFSKYKNSLIFLLYLDECWLNNSVEYLMIYLTLGNIPPMYRCLLEAITVLAAIPKKVVNSNGPYALQETLRDFVPFYDGVQVKIYDNSSKFYRGAVIVVIVDHKAGHKIGGFKNGFSRMKRFCRECLIHREEAMKSCDRKLFVERDTDEHDNIVHLIQQSPAYSSSLKSIYGIETESILHILPGFHCTQHLPGDVFHTEFEGDFKQEVCKFIEWCIDNKKYFTLRDLNGSLVYYRDTLQLLSYLPYSISEKFYRLEEGRGLSGMQIYCFGCIIPLLINKYIRMYPEILESIQYRSLKKHIEYLELLFAREFTEESIDHLDKTMSDHYYLNYKHIQEHGYRKLITKCMHLIILRNLVHWKELIQQDLRVSIQNKKH